MQLIFHDTKSEEVIRGFPMMVRTPPTPWDYGFVCEPIKTGELSADFLRVELKVDVGPIGLTLMQPDGSALIGAEIRIPVSPYSRAFYLALPANADVCVLFRTLEVEGPCQATVTDIRPVDTQTSLIDRKQREADSFDYWYYGFDLGGGVEPKVTNPNPEAAMSGAHNNLRIVNYLATKHGDGIVGKRLVDIACSGGYQPIQYAKQGAQVVAFDWDVNAIRQARFVASCLKDQFATSPLFLQQDLETFEPDAFGPFDLAISNGLFYHLENPLRSAKKLRRMTGGLAIVQCCVSPSADPIFEPSLSGKYPFIADWEFALVPSVSMLRWMWQKAGFNIEGEYRTDGFIFGSDTLAYEASKAGKEGANLNPVFHVLSPI